MKDRMIDNRKVNDNHQKGIERVKGIKMEKGQGGKMSQKKSSGNFKRSGSKLTPRKA